MGFLDTNDTGPAPTTALEAGKHAVTLTTLKWVASKDKGLAEFTSADSSSYTEWLNAASAGQKVRTRIFMQHLCALAGVKYRSPDDPDDFTALGAEIVAKATPLTIVLVDEEWNGVTKAKLSGKFEDTILADTGDIPF